MSIDHDQIHKTLFEHFFREFMELFFMQLAAEIDFDTVEFLRDEFFTDLSRGDRKLLDLVVKVRFKNGQTRVLLIHFEFESQRRAINYAQRFFEYYCVLFLRSGQPILTVAIFTDEEEWREPVVDTLDLRVDGGSGVLFKFDLIKLGELDYKQFLSSNNPLAYALMAKMNWARKDIVRMKADFLRLLLRTGVDPARRSLLVEYIETYMPLVERQQTELLALVQHEDRYEEINQMVTTYEQAGIKKGIITTRQEDIVRILRHRFTTLSAETISRIQNVTDPRRLGELLDQAFVVQSPSDLICDDEIRSE